tara:strand:- start:489 stop:824 length:336 start_codon:yes stop_codon:yes gene_type:complete
MEITGTIKQIGETKTFGEKNFEVRKLLLETKEDYPQKIQLEFTAKNCHLLDDYNINDEVKVTFSLKGREWKSPEGETKYFTTIAGRKINYNEELTLQDQNIDRNVSNDLPF